MKWFAAVIACAAVWVDVPPAQAAGWVVGGTNFAFAAGCAPGNRGESACLAVGCNLDWETSLFAEFDGVSALGGFLVRFDDLDVPVYVAPKANNSPFSARLSGGNAPLVDLLAQARRARIIVDGMTVADIDLRGSGSAVASIRQSCVKPIAVPRLVCGTSTCTAPGAAVRFENDLPRTRPVARTISEAL